MMSARDKCIYFISLHRTGLTVTLLTAALLLYPLYEDNPYTLGVTNLIAINYTTSTDSPISIKLSTTLTMPAQGWCP